VYNFVAQQWKEVTTLLYAVICIPLNSFFRPIEGSKNIIYVQTWVPSHGRQNGKKLQNSVLDGFITLAGGSRPSCCGARIHSVLTVICSLMGYFQGLNKCYEDLMHSIFTAGEVAF